MSKERVFVIVKSAFEAVHSWPECPIDEVAFLRHPHRHIFHVTVKIEVSHDDRDVEFIVFKRKVNEYLEAFYSGKDIGRESCEMIAKEIISYFSEKYSIHSVSVFEDNENGAEVVCG